MSYLKPLAVDQFQSEGKTHRIFGGLGIIFLQLFCRFFLGGVKNKRIAQLVKICLQCRRPQLDSWVGKIPWRSHRLPTLVFLGFCCGSAGKKSSGNVGDLGLIPGLGRSPGGGHGNPFQYSYLENPMHRGAWWATVSGVAKSRT